MYPEKYFLISDYQTMELLGVKGLFTNLRIDRESLPEGFFKYSIREGDDNPFSTVEKDVVVNHMGDFICKQELNLNGQDEYDIFDEYGFTDDEVDLDAFFGEDIKLKIAQEIDDFYYMFNTYEYRDSMSTGGSREEMVEDIIAGLDNKEYVEGMIAHFNEFLEENAEADFLEPQDEQKVRSFVCVLTEINNHNRDSLDTIVGFAEEVKEKQAQELQNKEPEIQQ